MAHERKLFGKSKDQLAAMVKQGGKARDEAIEELAARGRNAYGEKMSTKVRSAGYWNGAGDYRDADSNGHGRRNGKMGTHKGYTHLEVFDILHDYPDSGAKKKATGTSLTRYFPPELYADATWNRQLSKRLFSGPVYLRFMVLGPHATSERAKQAGWKKAPPQGGRYVVYEKFVKFDGNIAQLNREIRNSMLESGDFHHSAFETLDKIGTKNGLPIYNVGMGS